MTWTVKIRSSPGALMASDYECPVHGRFTATVARDDKGDPPAAVHCQAPADFIMEGDRAGRCGELSPWRISMPAVHTQFVVSASQGKPAPKPHREALDTRPLAEGRKKEWRLHRKKLKEERRHQRVKEYLK
ncbi:MAG: hypothetical protein ACM358_17055 [Gemmatimonadota bacterium]